MTKLDVSGKCADPGMFHKVFSNVIRQSYDKTVELAPEVKRHLNLCAFCREQEPRWRETAKHDGIQAFAQRVVTEGLENQPHIQKRNEGNLIYFFGQDARSLSGGYIVVWDDARGIIVHIQYGDLETFRRFTLK
jgi:hypothetical protein